jgi:hypothetical protein
LPCRNTIMSTKPIRKVPGVAISIFQRG